MDHEKLIVNRCFRIGEPDRDDANIHAWSDEPALELTEAGPVAWWTCTRCPARTLHDPETEDGFAEEPIVVYPPSCFDEPPWGTLSLPASADVKPTLCGCPRTRLGKVVHVEGCPDDDVQIESLALMAQRFGTQIGRAREEKTDPAPPSAELLRAMAEAHAVADLDDADDGGGLLRSRRLSGCA